MLLEKSSVLNIPPTLVVVLYDAFYTRSFALRTF